MAGAIIAKAILGAIGGGFEGAAKPYSSGNTGVKAQSTGAEKVGKEEDKKEMDKETKEVIDNIQKVQSNGDQKTTTRQAFNISDISNIGKTLNSDARLKEVYGESISDRIIEDFAKIAAIDFKYKPEAQKEYAGEHGVDDKEHTGVIAQELADTKSTESTVSPDENGNLSVDTQQLTMANTAAIAELSRRILTLETAIKEIMGKGE